MEDADATNSLTNVAVDLILDPLADDDTLDESPSPSTPQQQPNCDASEAPDAAVGAPDLRRSSSSSGVAASRAVGFGIVGRRSRSRSGGDDGDRASSELVLQLQRLCRRQRQRSEERAFVRDVERVLALLRVPTSAGVTSATFPGPDREILGSVQEEDDVGSDTSTFSSSISSSDRLQMSGVTLTLAEIDALLDCIGDLFDHRNPGVRTLAFEVVQLCLLRFGERLTPALRRKIYLRLETHSHGDFLYRQKALRALTQDGRHLEPFHVELGWFLLRLLEQSDAQRDLLGLIQSILRRSPRALDRDKVIALVSVISARCDMAWGRSDLDACHRFVAFYHVLATHDAAYAASTPACLRSLCCLVNADGHGTWSVMKQLLNGSSGFLVLRGLLHLLEHPTGVNSPWVLRGAVFFVGMSCWGSQRVAKFDDIAWAPILLALEQALQCCRGVVIFEVILSIQRLIKKFGVAHPSTGSSQTSTNLSSNSGDGNHDTASSGSSSSNSSNNRDKRRLVMEWDIILRMLQTLRPWVSMTDENEIEEAPQQAMHSRNIRTEHHTTEIHPANDLPDQPQHQLSVSIQQTRIPRELLDTLQAVEDLVEQHQFAGDVNEFLNILEGYLPHLNESSMLFLLKRRAEAAHPGYHLDWLTTLSATMRTFFSCISSDGDVLPVPSTVLKRRAEAAHPGYHLDWLTTLSATMRTFFSCISSDGDVLPVPSTVRLEALEVLRVNLWTSRNVCEDRVIEDVVLPMLGRVYEDPDKEVRRRSLGFIIEVARQLESVKFDSLVDILASAMMISSNEETQVVAASGIVTLFSSAFDHLPPARAVRMYDLLATTVETHRNRAVRHVALSCLLNVCEARATDGKLQWNQQQVRTSRFLFVSRRAARIHATGIQITAACVPVARALRALLTLVSTEPDAELFRMAVKGIKIMLENRAILEDVDVSEVSAKVVASIDYRAFGRAAIVDEVEKLFSDQTNEQNPVNADTLVRRDQKVQENDRSSIRSVPQTDAELLRSIHASTRSMSTGGIDNTEVSFSSSVRATAALLVKTRFLAMGIELLQLLVSYESQLHENALQDVTRCLVDVMGLRLVVAERDLFAGGSAGDEAALCSSSSTPNMLYGHEETGTELAVPYASGTTLGFTSRVLSRFQTSASHGNLFHALSGSVSKSSLRSSSASTTTSHGRPTRKDRALLQGFLRQLFDSEFNLLHTTTTALSLLALLTPTIVLNQVVEMLPRLRGCVTTVDGDFRPDAFVAVLELLGTIMHVLHADSHIVHSAHKAIMEALLLGFEYAKSKQLSYLAFRLLCQVIYQSDRKERRSLAAVAMPTLQQVTRRANSILAETAVDFLMCYAYSQSVLAPSALCTRQQFGHDDNEMTGDLPQSKSKSWVYKRSLLTITTNLHGNAVLVIRRANSTSRWDLNSHHNLSLDPAASSNLSESGGYYSTSSDQLLQRPTTTIGSRNSAARKRLALPPELRPSFSSHSTARLEPGNQSMTRSNSRVDNDLNSTQESMTDKDIQDVQAGSFLDSTAVERIYQASPVASALPPLPAYDGIGGSPSYYYENTQVRRQPQQNANRPLSRNSKNYSRQTEGDDGQEGLSGKPSIRVIREDVEENCDTESRQRHVENEQNGAEMDAFSLDGGVNDVPSPSIPEITPGILQNADNIASAASGRTLLDDVYDPMHLMMQLFDLTVENRPQLLMDGPSLKLALSVLDRTPEYETHKIGLLYVRDEKQSSEAAILGNTGGSLRYLQFLRRLGTFTKLEGLPGYTGGLDTTNNSDGKFGLIYKDECAQIMFHVATMMVPGSGHLNEPSAADTFASMKKKRHIGNDFVHVVFKECDTSYDLQTLSGQFNDVHIIIQPLNDREYRTEVHVKPGIPPFGPLYGRQIVPSAIISESVRLTCLNANLACQVFHQDLVGFALNCEERLKQIKQLGLRLGTADEWKLD
ncbi:hypothetical protein PHMEG_0001671 [Phytophthora megakarya]|uniref:Rap-GAP domain-containing protein n=1 Tax=Phytophthora megakarya TaxID=4795 RepID=A0A225X0K1_9STRA|nr:hypothetical protein PHMEG_0001671 [Phytophthora megakarya]